MKPGLIRKGKGLKPVAFKFEASRFQAIPAVPATVSATVPPVCCLGQQSSTCTPPHHTMAAPSLGRNMSGLGSASMNSVSPPTSVSAR
jgi:hypothetical protein